MFASAATMSVESSITMIAPEPDMVPAMSERIEIVWQIQHVDLLLDVLAVRVLALELELLAGLENFGR